MDSWERPITRDVPSPTDVAAWFTVGGLPIERVPLWAAYWLVAGFDGDNLVALAGLSGDDPREVRDLLPAALAECHVPPIESDQAAVRMIFTEVARLHAAGRVDERWIVDKVSEIAENFDYAESVRHLPLGDIVGIEDEWGADWGRSTEQLRSVVQQACRDQLRGEPTA